MSRLKDWTLASISHMQKVGLKTCSLMGLFDGVVGGKKFLSGSGD